MVETFNQEYLLENGNRQGVKAVKFMIPIEWVYEIKWNISKRGCKYTNFIQQ
jgi:hypothetical protein